MRLFSSLNYWVIYIYIYICVEVVYDGVMNQLTWHQFVYGVWIWWLLYLDFLEVIGDISIHEAWRTDEVWFIAFIPVNDGGFFDDFWRDQKRYCFWTSEIYETMIKYCSLIWFMITHSTTRVVVPSFSDVPNEGHQSIILLCLRMVDYITYNITYWLVVYPSEKYESVGMMKFPTEWKVVKFHGSKPPTSI